ncbi:putative uncharacterized FRG domain protein [Moritella viscosa]|nr:putative uncharacterized FRG domain protein [Moritella viscosa]
MKQFFIDTFGGLKTSYLIRQYIFAIFLALFFSTMMTKNGHVLSFGEITMLTINTALYPYSRFVYESIVEFIVGENNFYVNTILMLFVKFITMAICWSTAILISPLGLAYIYFRNTREAN